MHHTPRLRARSIAAAFLLAAAVRGLPAQRPATGTVTGIVRDSASRAPMPGAVVQITAEPPGRAFTRAARSDSLGRYTIDSVPPGRYAIGFLHARLDSLGVQAAVRTVQVVAGRAARADLTTPSAKLLRSTYCTDPGGRGALVLGVVRRASDRTPVANAEVVGEWVELVMRGGQLERQQPALYARTGDDGGYALCDVPAAGSVFVSANVGPDTTDRIELVGDQSGVLRRDLYVAPVRSIARTDSATFARDSIVRRPLRAGDGTLRGSVLAADGGAPMPGATVRIVDGPETRANARGEWALTGVPAGTRVLEVRSIGYYPQQIPVDVVQGSAPVRVALWTFQSVLDTVRVIAARGGDRSGGGFARRARSAGMGTFVDSAQLRARGGNTTSDVFRSMNGVRIDGVGPERTISVRGAFGYCAPSVFIDGLYMPTPYVDDIDLMASRATVTGIEVYRGGIVPAEFQRSLTGCGAIVIWTRPAQARPRRRSP